MPTDDQDDAPLAGPRIIGRAVLLSDALSGGGEGAVEVDHVARDPGQAR